MKRKINHPQTFYSILIGGIMLLLVAAGVSFTYQGIVVHAQAPSIFAMITNHTLSADYTSATVCSSVDSIISSDIDVALDQCGINGETFRVSVVDWNATSTSIKASLQGQGVLYVNQCASIACATAKFSARAGNVICYQASGETEKITTKTEKRCYTVPANSSNLPTPTPTFPLHKGNGSPTATPTLAPPLHKGNRSTPTPTPLRKSNGPTPTPSKSKG